MAGEMEFHKAAWYVGWRMAVLIFVLGSLFVLFPALMLGFAKGFETTSKATLLMYGVMLFSSLLSLTVSANVKFMAAGGRVLDRPQHPILKTIAAGLLAAFAVLLAVAFLAYPHGQPLGSYMYGVPMFGFSGYMLYLNTKVFRDHLI